MEAMDQTDLVVAVGYDIAEYTPEMWNPDGEKSIVYIDFEPAEVYTHYQPEVELVADISVTLRNLYRSMDTDEFSFDTEWLKMIRETVKEDIFGLRTTDRRRIYHPGDLKRAPGLAWNQVPAY